MTLPSNTRRGFLKASTGALAAGVTLNTPVANAFAVEKEPLFKISLGEWSLHRALFGGKLKHFDVAKVARKDFGIDALEHSAQFFMDKAEDQAHLRELKKHVADQGVKSVLITVDNQGALGDPDENKRIQAVTNHHKWVDAAKFLGCHSIRVNAISDEKLSYDEQARLVADGLSWLTEFGAVNDMNILVENHGGPSSNAQWLVGVVRAVNHPNCGTLPDFGNFQVKPGEMYDRYQGVAELMPFAKAVSTKAHRFDAEGNETATDYRKMLKIVLDANYHDYIGVEYEGDQLSEADGILATKRLLETIRDELA